MDMMRIVGLVVLVLLLLVCAFFGSQDAMRNVQTVSTPGEWTVVVAQFVYVASAILAVAAMGARKSRLATGFLRSWALATVVAASVAPAAYGGASIWAGVASGAGTVLLMWVLLWIWKKRPPGLDTTSM
jgi:hypothetical protein